MLNKPSQIRWLSFVVLLCAGSASAQQPAPKERPTFKELLVSGVTPISGNDGGILQIAEARYIATFSQAADRTVSFDSYFYNNNVGGIVLRNQPLDTSESLKLDRLTFHLDESKNPPIVLIKMSAAGKRVDIPLESSLVAVAARMAADDQLVLVTMAAGSASNSLLTPEEMLAIHPAIARHRLSIAAATIDDSFGSVSNVDATYWVLSESPWKLSPDSFSNNEALYTLECRGLQTKIEIPNLTARWKRELNPKQAAALRKLNDFIAIYRLINAAAEGYVDGFPEEEFISLLKRIQAHYEAQAVTIEEEQDFHRWLTRR